MNVEKSTDVLQEQLLSITGHYDGCNYKNSSAPMDVCPFLCYERKIFDLGGKKFKPLYIAINEMMAILGADGEVNTKQMAVINVMDALAEIDGGEFDTAKVFGG